MRARTRRRLPAAAPLLFCAALALAPVEALAANGDCGQPSSNGLAPIASDALFALRAAVGNKSCDLCVCDVNGDGKLSASDALRLLKKAVNQPGVTLACPACVPKLVGFVTAPVDLAMIAFTTIGPSVDGLGPVPGATVELLNLDSEGVPQLPVLASTTSDANGRFSFSPKPAPGSQTIVRTSVGGAALRAFVGGDRADLSPESEFLVAAAVNAVVANPSAGLASLTTAEFNALSALLKQTRIDFYGSTTIADAVAKIGIRTGGVYEETIADFATTGPPAASIAAGFHLVGIGAAFTHSYQPFSGNNPSVNIRSITASGVNDPFSITSDGVIAEPAHLGRENKLTETSGATFQQSGPAIAINASATLESSDIQDGPSGATATLLASSRGELLLQTDGFVSPGVIGSGSAFALIPHQSASQPLFASDGDGSLDFVLRQSQGLSNSSLSATYSAVQFEIDLQANSDASNVHREVQARSVAGTISFDGNGHTTLGSTTGSTINLRTDGPPPDKDPSSPVVLLSTADDSQPAVNGLGYTLSSTGALTVNSGAAVVASGAVTPDRNVVVLRIGDDSTGSGASGFLIGLRRGSGMNNSSGQGTYRIVDFAIRLQRNVQTGTPDISPSSTLREIGVSGSVGTFTLDGAGTVAVGGSAWRSVFLSDNFAVQYHAQGSPDVFDASTIISTDAGADTAENHTYSVASNGIVTVDAANNGGLEGYLSPDGNVFVLPTSNGDSSQQESGLLIAVREP